MIIDVAALESETIAIGGGARGLNLHLSPPDLADHLGADVAEVS